MDTVSQTKWDKIYLDSEDSPPATAAKVLQHHQHWLPGSGQAVDFASGRGGNAKLLAEHGLDTLALDISAVALQQLERHCAQADLSIQTRVVDLKKFPIAPSSVDVLVCSYYLDRSIFAMLAAALKPNGLLFYETFNKRLPAGKGPSNPDFLLDRAELLNQFSSLQLVFYEELFDVADQDGDRGVSRLVARKS